MSTDDVSRAAAATLALAEHDHEAFRALTRGRERQLFDPMTTLATAFARSLSEESGIPVREHLLGIVTDDGTRD